MVVEDIDGSSESAWSQNTLRYATLSDFRSFRPYVIQIFIRCSNRNFPCISVLYPNCMLPEPYFIQGSTVYFLRDRSSLSTLIVLFISYGWQCLWMS